MEQKQPSRKETIFDIEDFNVDKYKAEIDKARYSLFGACGIVVLGGIISTVNPTTDVDLFYVWLEILVVAGSFLVLGLMSATKPYSTLVWGLVLFSIYIIVGIFIDPLNMSKAMIWKILIIVVLVRGLRKAAMLKNIKQIRDSAKKYQ